MNFAAAKLMMLICFVGGPGNSRQAQPFVDQFMRHVEKTAGFKAGTMVGTFTARRKRCQRLLSSKRPGVVVLDIASYLALRKSAKLSPFAHMGRVDKKRYFLLVRGDSGIKSVAALAGKKVVSTERDTRFLSRVVFAGKKIDAAKHLKLSFTRRPLRAVRKVARKRAAAAIVDEQVVAHLSELKLGVKLVPIHRSRKLPSLTMTIVKARVSKVQRTGLRRALPSVCSGAGAKLCKTFSIATFKQAKRSVLRRLERLYR